MYSKIVAFCPIFILFGVLVVCHVTQAIKISPQPGLILCEDNSICRNVSTCCRTQFGNFGCCALPDAHCCDNHVVCCPKEYHCTEHEPYCELSRKPRAADIDAEHLIEAELIIRTVRDPIKTNIGNGANNTCPIGTCLKDEQCCYDKNSNSSGNNSSDTFAGCCPLLSTCCNSVSTGKYIGSCPTVNAVCCSDEKHCCPEGYKCSQSSDMCVKFQQPESHSGLDDLKVESKLVVNDESKVFGVIEPSLKSISAPEKLQMPSNYTSSLGLGGLFVSFVETANGAQACNSDDGKPTVYCNDKYTCCEGTDGYMCCPMQNAVCCADKKNCCPKGTSCDTTNDICTK